MLDGWTLYWVATQDCRKRMSLFVEVSYDDDYVMCETCGQTKNIDDAKLTGWTGGAQHICYDCLEQRKKSYDVLNATFAPKDLCQSLPSEWNEGLLNIPIVGYS
jgi:hypothetical protein